MKRYILGLALLLVTACTGNHKNVSSSKNHVEPKVQNTPRSQARIDSSIDEKALPTPKVKPLKKSARTVDQAEQHRSPATSVTPEINRSTINTPYVNPNFNAWDVYFGSDPKWVALYQESLTHYLQGLVNNLEQNTALRMERSMIVFVYGKKMEDAFMLTPEFAEYAKIRFEKSTELAAFVRTYPSRIIKD
jgi:hypothetical protein